MTNAQAALIAAASEPPNGYVRKDVLTKAKEYLEWLDNQQTEAGTTVWITEPSVVLPNGSGILPC